MGTPLYDAIVTLKQHLFFLTGYPFLQENVCLTLLPKNAHGTYTAAYTMYGDFKCMYTHNSK